MKSVLLTGATGYVGRRLMGIFAAEPGVRLRLLVRSAAKLGAPPSPSIEVVEGTTFDHAALGRAMAGVDTAYYLVHSMGSGGNFPELERRSAENFREAALEAGVRRVVYLGGLGTKDTGSKHLRSRLETGEILSARPDRLQVLWFRAGTVIGSGSASFEIIRNLVAKLPVMTTPRWVKTRTQPIGIADVCAYLRAALDLDARESLIIDIGAEAMSFREMLLGAAKVMGLRRHIIPVPVLSPRLSSYWLILMTPVPFSIARALVEGLKSETVVLNDNAARFFPAIRPRPYEDAFAAAVYADKRRRVFGGVPAAAVFRAVTSIGGRRGWLAQDWL